MKLCCAILFVVLLSQAALAQLTGEPATPLDTLRTDSLALWSDTTAVLADSTAPADVRHAWLYPMSLVMLTCMGFFMLFSARSH